MSTQSIIALGRAIDEHIDRKVPKILGAHVDELGIVEATNPVRIHLLHSGVDAIESETYFCESCPPSSLAVGDTVLVIGVFNDNVVVSRVRLGAFQRGPGS